MSYFKQFMIAVIAIGGFMAFVGSEEWRLANSASITPREIPLIELEQNGPGDNGHVILSQWFLSSHAAYETDSKHGNGPWKRVCVPVISPFGKHMQAHGARLHKLAEAKAPPEQLNDEMQHFHDFNVVILSNQVTNPEQLDALHEQEKLQGLVVSSVRSLDKEMKSTLRKQYPGLDVDNLIVVALDRKPWGHTWPGLLIGAGVVVMGIGGFFLIRPASAEPETAAEPVTPDAQAPAPDAGADADVDVDILDNQEQEASAGLPDGLEPDQALENEDPNPDDQIDDAYRQR